MLINEMRLWNLWFGWAPKTFLRLSSVAPANDVVGSSSRKEAITASTCLHVSWDSTTSLRVTEHLEFILIARSLCGCECNTSLAALVAQTATTIQLISYSVQVWNTSDSELDGDKDIATASHGWTLSIAGCDQPVFPANLTVLQARTKANSTSAETADLLSMECC